MMADQSDEYDFFVSYARADNASDGSGPGWIEQCVNALLDELCRFTGGRSLRRFFDRRDISNFASWESEILHKGLLSQLLCRDHFALLLPRTQRDISHDRAFTP